MSKRSDTIRSLFAQPPSPVLSADNNLPEPRRVASGAVRSMKETFSEIERENEILRARFAGGEQVVEIDADLIDPSPFADRFAQEDDPSFESLNNRLPNAARKFPSCFAPTRQRRAATRPPLGTAASARRASWVGPVKSIVRELSDDELIIAQGLENSAREDLSFIERAVFALRLEVAGRSRAVIQQALTIDRAEASKLISVAKAVPEDLILAIGKATRIGRGRWQEFAEVLSDTFHHDRVRVAASSPRFAKATRRTVCPGV